MANLRSALLNLAELRSKHSLDGGLYLVYAVIDYSVAADIDSVALGVLRRDRVGSDVEADDYRMDAFASMTSDSFMAPTPPWIILTLTSSFESFSRLCLTASTEP